jgi:hypothetical protein
MSDILVTFKKTVKPERLFFKLSIKMVWPFELLCSRVQTQNENRKKALIDLSAGKQMRGKKTKKKRRINGAFW